MRESAHFLVDRTVTPRFLNPKFLPDASRWVTSGGADEYEDGIQIYEAYRWDSGRDGRVGAASAGDGNRAMLQWDD
jgi:hypothetical protein